MSFTYQRGERDGTFMIKIGTYFFQQYPYRLMWISFAHSNSTVRFQQFTAWTNNNNNNNNNIHYISAWIFFFKTLLLSTWINCDNRVYKLFLFWLATLNLQSCTAFFFFSGILWQFHVICFLDKMIFYCVKFTNRVSNINA